MNDVLQQPSVLAFGGQGRSPFLCRLIARPGAYSGTVKAVLTFRNVAGVTISGFQIDANNEAEICGDFAFKGNGPSMPPRPAITNLRTSGVRTPSGTGWNMDQAADSKVSAVHYDGGTASVGLSLRLGGGGIWADNIFLGTGKLLVASHNCGLQNCGFFGGVQITDESTNYIHFDSCHFYPILRSGSWETILSPCRQAIRTLLM